MTWNDITIYNYNTGTDYASILIGGLYGITLITLTIYGILAERIRRKAVGVQILKLFRYNILTMFFPVTALTTYVILMMYYEILNESWTLSILALCILVYIVIHATLILQIFYKPEKLKDAILKKHMKEISNISKKENYKELEKKIIIRLKQFFFQEDNNSDEMDIIIENDDLKKLLKHYLRCRKDHNEKEYSEKFCKEVIEAGIKIYKNNFAEELIFNGVPHQYVLNTELSYRDLNNYNEFSSFFKQLYDYYMLSKQQDNLESCLLLITKFCIIIAREEIILHNLLTLMTSNEYNPGDYEYFKDILKVIIKFQDDSKYHIEDDRLNNIINKIKERTIFEQPEFSKEEIHVFNAISKLMNGDAE